MHYKIHISYDGLPYKGWQRLPDNTKTIQETLENALSQFFGEPIHITGSGRTDAGVSAICQVADFFCIKNILERSANTDIVSKHLTHINTLLPDDITITHISEVDDSFHSRKSATSKTYIYLVALDEKPDVFSAKYVYTPERTSLNFDAMRSAAANLIGTHDFSAFTSDKDVKKSHIRTVTDIAFDIIELTSQKRILAIKVSGNGFLYNMVRIIAGTLVFAGLGKLEPDEISSIIKSKSRKLAGPTLPSNALFLHKVEYD